MSKVKDNLTAQCTECELLYPKRRAELGYTTCLTCGEAQARKVKHAEELEKLAGGKADLLRVFMQYRNGEISKEYVDNYIDATLVSVPIYTPTIKQLNEDNDNGEV